MSDIEFSTERAAGVLRVTCLVCDRFIIHRDKGMGRAHIAAWKTRHQHEAATATEVTP